MGTEILVSTLQMLSMFYLTIVVLRFLFQLCQVDYFNPISQFIAKATNPVTQPIRSIIPGPALRLRLTDLRHPLPGADVRHHPLHRRLRLHPRRPYVGCTQGRRPDHQHLLLRHHRHDRHQLDRPRQHPPGIQLIHQITEPIIWPPSAGLLPPMGGLDLSPILVFLVLNMVMVVMRGTWKQRPECPSSIRRVKTDT